MSRFWRNRQTALIIVQPETVIRWHRQGFKLYWKRKSRADKPGRPPIEREIRDLIQRMSRENPTWGAPRILSELLLLGYDVAEATVAKYMVRSRKPPSQTWRTFLDNHVPDIAACDFFTLPTAMFRVLYVFIILRHNRRQVVHFNVTTNPSAQCSASLRTTSTTIIISGHIYRWIATRRRRVMWNRHCKARLSLFGRSAAYNTDTRVRRECETSA